MSSWHEARAGLRLPDLSSSGGVVLAFALVGVAAGYLIANQSLVPMILLLGAIIGVALLNALSAVIWIVIAGALLISGPIMLFLPDLDRIGWLFSLLGFYLAVAALLYAAIGRERFARPAPGFVLLTVAFFVYGMLSLLYSDGPLDEGIRAIKRYYQFTGLLLILAVVPFLPRQVERWWRFVMIVAMLQLPFALYQRVFLVPIRETMSGVIPIDIVAGTMEASMNGGGNAGTMVLFLVTALAFFLSAARDGVISKGVLALGLLATAIPIALGEVTLSIVLLPLALLATFADLVSRRPGRFLIALIVGVPLLVALAWAYLVLYSADGQSLDQKIAQILEYNIGSQGYFGTGLNRLTIYTYWWSMHSLAADPVSMLFGHGLGSAFGPVGALETGHMHQEHRGMYIGLTAASTVLWDLGALGLLLLVATYASAAVWAYRLARGARPGVDRALCRTLSVLSAMLPVMLLYSDTAVSAPSQQVLASLCLGLIAWRSRSGRA